MTSPDMTSTAEDPRHAAAAALRRLGHAVVAHEADPDLLLRVAEQATATAEVVEAGVRRTRDVVAVKRELWEEAPPTGGRMAHFEECVVSGRANPMGIMMEVTRDGDEVVGDITLGAAFEGAPRRAHGGIVAAILDDIMGYQLLVQATPAYTGRLQVRYTAPTPVEAPLVARSWLESRDGRKLQLRATLATPDGDVLAEGDALFIAIPPERFTDPDR
ncbi:PaaI family thioesterase [Euzebya sp.]|uniref:PaaI family thioesterase n=1 Tax=Euzebya sp. TaxID=1971409 RepID=UPI00351346E6